MQVMGIGLLLAQAENQRYIIMGVLILLAAAAVVFLLWRPKEQTEEDILRQRMSGRRGDDQADAAQIVRRESTTTRTIGELAKKLGPTLARPLLPTTQEEQSNLKTRLQNAGFHRDQASQIFLASKMILMALVGISALILLRIQGYESNQMWMYTIFGAGFSFLLPNFWLSVAINSRQEKIRHALPDCLDLLVVSVEAGLGLDGAIQRVSDELSAVHPEMAEELWIAVREGQIGVPRAEALDHLSIRTGVEEVRSVVAVITQAERFGTSVAGALRNQANAMRVKRRQKAEEAAAKVAVKLLLPLILFIFPAIFVVLAGPACMKVAQELSNM
jgi:tight adherence protein C